MGPGLPKITQAFAFSVFYKVTVSFLCVCLCLLRRTGEAEPSPATPQLRGSAEPHVPFLAPEAMGTGEPVLPPGTPAALG